MRAKKKTKTSRQPEWVLYPDDLYRGREMTAADRKAFREAILKRRAQKAKKKAA